MSNRFIVIRHGRKTLLAELLPGSKDVAHVVADCFGSEHNARKLQQVLTAANEAETTRQAVADFYAKHA